jgi:hypothetical protein
MKAHSRLLDLDIIVLVILGAFAAAFLIETRTYNPTAALFPRLVSIISLFFILWSIAQRCWTLFHKQEALTESDEEGSGEKKDSMAWYATAGTMVAYFVLIYILGFTATTLIYLVATPFLLGYGKRWLVFLVGILWTVGFVVVFSYVLHSRIPEGLLGNFFHGLIYGSR